MNGDDIVVRNPFSTRPYQHVLEPLYAYLMIASMQYENDKYQSWYNVGPDDSDCFQTGALVDLFVKYWGDGVRWINKCVDGPHEANFLKLDCSKIRAELGWRPVWGVKEAVGRTVEFSKALRDGRDAYSVMQEQIGEYFSH